MPRWIARGSLALVLAAMGSGCSDTSGGVRSPSGQTSKSGQSSKSGQGLTFVGFDSNPMLVEALRQGKLQGLVLQNPYQMGDLGVRSAVAHLEDAEVTSRIGTGEKLATPENISDPAIVELLNPPKATSSTDAEVPKEKTKQWRLLVIPKSTANEFWQTVHAGAIKAAEELGNVEIIWKGPEKEDDYTKQIDLIEKAKALGVDGIVLAPVDSKVLVSPVERVIDQEIPVVIIDSALESKRTVSFVATDNYHGGVLAAKRMAVVLGDKGNVIVLRHMVGSESTEQREQGFLETIARYPEIKVLSQNKFAGATVETAKQTAMTLIKDYKDQVNGIFCSNEQSTTGMLNALEEAGMLKRGEAAAAGPPGGTKKAP